MARRVLLIVLDSVGIGELPDAAQFGDEGSDTLHAAAGSTAFVMPNMASLGLFDIDGVKEWKCELEGRDWWQKQPALKPSVIARMTEQSTGKDTTIGHWEIAGVISKKPLPVFPDGFPEELLQRIREAAGRDILCNKPYSGTQVIRDYGDEMVATGSLIVYTSADSVLQIAAHEEVIPVEELYDICEKCREICAGEVYGVGRVIARPFLGESGNYFRTKNRHDYSLKPPKKTMLNRICEAGLQVYAVGKISDIFAGDGITRMVRTADNADGIDRTIAALKEVPLASGLIFTNLVDYDMLYGHRNDVEGYAKALAYFDERLPEILDALQEEDLLMITADHGCDPSTPSTDHSREYTPLVIVPGGSQIGRRYNLGTLDTFARIGEMVEKYLLEKENM